MEQKKISDFNLPLYKEIPNVGLYLEQTQKFIAEYLDGYSSFSITSSMISNYVKKKLITNPVKKQYYRDQIAYLIIIAVAKSVLSLEDIQLLFDMKREVWDAEGFYDIFCENLKNYLNGDGSPDEDNDKDLYLIKHIAMTIAHKMQVDSIFLELRADENE